MAGLFGSVDQKEFESFKNEISKRIISLEKRLDEKVTDSEEAAKDSARKAEVSATNAAERAVQINEIYVGLEEFQKAVRAQLEKIQADEAAIAQRISAISAEAETFRDNYNAISELRKQSNSAYEDIKARLVEVNSASDLSKRIMNELGEAGAKLSDAQKMRMDIEAILNNSVSRNGEIQGLYDEIYGRDLKDESGEIKHIDGLKDKLDKSYQSVSEGLSSIQEKMKGVEATVIQSYAQKLTEIMGRMRALVGAGQSKIDSVNAELDSLLPGAMAAGLSAAYEQKAREESDTQVVLEKRFRNAIAALVVVSLIPFAVDVELLVHQQKNIVEVIQGTPNLILAILPLYFPILWFAYSTGKKLNLTKRLIEEYTHKSSLGKTFAGLSKQIESMSDGDEVKRDLRVSLLFNFLQVSSENPGKLITNYDKADHPLMEALENSSRLSSSVDALAKLPGFGALAKRIAERADSLLKKEASKVEAGIQFNAGGKSPEGSSTETG